MLTSLHIQDFAIVDRQDVDFEAGLTTLTGETGAGKSIIVGALGALCGDRLSADLIRHGAERAEISAGFDLKDVPAARQLLEEQELADGDELVVRRLIFAERAGRCFVNGRPAPVATLKALGQTLVDIHGQHENQSLMRRDEHRRIIDRFGGLEADRQRLAEIHDAHRDLLREKESLTGEPDDSRLDYLKFQLKELESLDLGENEYADLESRQRRLSHSQDLARGMAELDSLLGAEEGGLGVGIGRAESLSEELTAFDDRLGPLRTMLAEARVNLDEAAALAARLSRDADVDPGELDQVEARLGRIFDLARKHRVAPGALPEHVKQLALEVERLENQEQHVAEFDRRLAQLERDYTDAADRLSAARREAAGRLEAAVMEVFPGIGLKGASFRVEFPDGRRQMTRYGFDDPEFLVSANPDGPLRPLSKVASGGELSRISLAIQVVAASLTGTPVLVFDEVDVGIGGRVADQVGERLKALAADRQVICITHLPQVAAKGHHHLRVSKLPDDAPGVRIDTLDEASRIDEIARMLAGEAVTEESRANARRFLNTAMPA